MTRNYDENYVRAVDYVDCDLFAIENDDDFDFEQFDDEDIKFLR